jgi:hypothetical protein
VVLPLNPARNVSNPGSVYLWSCVLFDQQVRSNYVGLAVVHKVIGESAYRSQMRRASEFPRLDKPGAFGCYLAKGVLCLLLVLCPYRIDNNSYPFASL